MRTMDGGAQEGASGRVTQLAIQGMTCGNCARHVAEAIQSVPAVAHASASLETTRATVRWKPEATPDLGAVLRAVQEAGFAAEPVSATCPAEAKPGGAERTWAANVTIGIIPTVLLMAGDWVFRLGMEPWFRWTSFFLALAVQAGPGTHFYKGAWRQLKARSSNMDTLVALGSTTAFAYSAWALFSGRPEHLYFMEAAAIITLISLGHYFEARVSARASSALQALLHLAPDLARRLSSDGTESEVPVAELRAGDTVVIRPGDRVPTDGAVMEGESAVDEAMLTGESVPVDKKRQDSLYAGTVNLNGRLLMGVTATGEATALAQVIAAVERAQTSRAKIQRLGDRVSSVFVPIVVLIAALTGLWWGLAPEAAHQTHLWLAQHVLWPAHPPAGNLAAAFIIAASVLIVACPCAMGLATPAAIMAGSNAAAQRGILIRDALALEKAGDITAVIFDKTGTLTIGKPTVAHFESFAEDSQLPAAPASIAAALARRSSHPLSQAVARFAPGELPFAEWREIRGAGVEGKLDGASRTSPATFRLGALKWLAEAGVDLTASQTPADQWAEQGATILGLARDKTLLGLAAVKDTVKPHAREVTDLLHRQGLKTFMLTGDNPRTAAGIARQAGIPADHVFAEVRPEQKAEFVQRLQQKGERVAFVGDGINDAPALEQADLGIAVARASDVAREAADLILLKSEIEAVPESLGLARATLRTIRQNLFWAFFYNAASIPLAALGFMSPVLCAAAMGFSDLIVIGNALRLRRWKLKR